MREKSNRNFTHTALLAAIGNTVKVVQGIYIQVLRQVLSYCESSLEDIYMAFMLISSTVKPRVVIFPLTMVIHIFI